MITYIKITNYMSGASLKEQINELIDAGKIDEDVRLFFAKNNSLTMRDLASIWVYFDFEHDLDFDSENLVLKPRKSILSMVERGSRLI